MATRVGTSDSSLVPSILDRLLDDQPTVSQEPTPKRRQTARELERAVARDLEDLLNTRQETLEELAPEYQEVNRSLVTYGLPDLTAWSLAIEEDRARVLRAVERTIAKFEPRLQRVRVQLEAPRNSDRGLRFRIDALLRMDPTPEPVSFDAVLQLSTQQYVVQGQA
jgi:type VI secretion system protein ImpF